jgi:hypothetical protein
MCSVVGIVNLSGLPVGPSDLEIMDRVVAPQRFHGGGISYHRNMRTVFRRLAVIDPLTRFNRLAKVIARVLPVRWLRKIWDLLYFGTIALLYPINLILSRKRRHIVYKNSVLHISFMVHEPFYTVKILRKYGLKADYLAIGESPLWNKSDFCIKYSILPNIRALQEFFWFWRLVAKYDVIHSHFMVTLTMSGWELSVLKKMGRKIVIRYAGCEIRNREKNMTLHPDVNICQDCDYQASICKSEVNRKKRELFKKHGDVFLVTTPDMKDFVPEAEHFPFFAPEVNLQSCAYHSEQSIKKSVTKIVHATVHPGVEGTKHIERAINNLKNKGYKINFVFLNGVTHHRVLEEFQDADLSIGKMKMGYYANAQIESMFLGVPTITYVRPDFMNRELEDSGLIFTTIDKLQETLEYYLTHPEELENKRRIARASILRLHNNEKLAKRLIDLYQNINP